MWRRLLLVLGALVVAGIAYLALWPVPIDPVAWDPPPAPAMTGVLAPNHDLVASRRLLEGFGSGPEDVAFDAAGNVYTGFEDGRIVRVPLTGGGGDVVADTGGRPLGMVFDATDDLVVADATRGLLAVAPDGSISVLATAAGAVPFGFADDLDITPDGTVYFTDASDKFGYGHDTVDIIEHAGRGRLLAYDPASGEVRVVMDGLQFANGVTVAPDGSHLLVAETGAYRIRRLWLSGPRAGASDVFADNLPGFPDNINYSPRGTVWVALPTPRIAALDAMGPHPFLRKLTMRLPTFMQPAPVRYGLAVELAPDGHIIRSLQDPSGEVAFVTSVMERDGVLVLGSYKEHSLVVVDIATDTPPPKVAEPSTPV